MHRCAPRGRHVAEGDAAAATAGRGEPRVGFLAVTVMCIAVGRRGRGVCRSRQCSLRCGQRRSAASRSSGRMCSSWRASAVLRVGRGEHARGRRTRWRAQTRRVRSRVRDVPVRSMRRHADATTASSSSPRCSARRRARALASAEQREKVCAVLRICSCAMPERRMPRKVFFSLRTGSRTRAWMPPAPRAAVREMAGRIGVLQKSAGITAVFVCVEVSPWVSQRLLSRSGGGRSRRSVRSRHATPEKKLRRTVDSKKKRD